MAVQAEHIWTVLDGKLAKSEQYVDTVRDARCRRWYSICTDGVIIKFSGSRGVTSLGRA
jgi:hypothetical protein